MVLPPPMATTASAPLRFAASARASTEATVGLGTIPVKVAATRRPASSSPFTTGAATASRAASRTTITDPAPRRRHSSGNRAAAPSPSSRRRRSKANISLISSLRPGAAKYSSCSSNCSFTSGSVLTFLLLSLPIRGPYTRRADPHRRS